MPVFLSNIRYNEQGREIILEYSSSQGKTISREKFFPKLFLDKRFNKELLKEIILFLEKNSLMITDRPNSIEVKARDFSSLKSFLNLLRKTTEDKTIIPLSIIEPERQYLIEKDFSFFERFEEYKGKPFKAKGIPGIKHCLEETGLHLFEGYAERMALATLLKTVPESIPMHRTGPAETFLENAFFKQKLPFPSTLHERKNPPRLSTINASTIAEQNLGFESINCSCCASREDNLAPSSKAKIKFLKDAVYFNSLSRDYSERFHSNNPNKQARIDRKKEFCLLSMPVGPFYKGNNLEILLADLPYLERKGLAELITLTEKTWFCTRKQSFLSKTLETIIAQKECLEKAIRVLESSALNKHNLAAFPLLEEDLDYSYLCALENALTELISLLPAQLVYPKSKFFEERLAENIALIDSVLAENPAKQRAKALASS